MNAHTLGMNPGTKIEDGSKLIGVRFLSCGYHRVQFLDERTELSFKIRYRIRNLIRIDSILAKNPHLQFLEAWFTAERADETRIRNGKVLHQSRMPAPCRGDRWDLPQMRGERDSIENLAKVPPQLVAVLIPVRHLTALESCSELARSVQPGR